MESNPGTPRTFVDLTGYDDVTAVWRCPHASVQIDGKGDEHYHLGTLIRLDGEAHTRRRRAMGLLLARRGHVQFRDKWLVPIADAAVKELLAQADSEGVSIEVVKWGRRVSQQLAAAMAGYDEGTTPDGADRLFALSQRMIAGRPSLLEVIAGSIDETDPVYRDGLAAKREIIETFHEPALRRREQMIREVEAGRRSQEDLPVDFLTVAAQKVDPAWNDPAQVERDAVLLLGAAVHTTTNSLAWALREIFEWAERHPDQTDRLFDDAFLLAAAEESLRLHPVVPAISRRLAEALELPGGKLLDRETVAMLRLGPAGSDPEYFGEDSRTFNPDRKLTKKVARYGLAFGQSSHMCLGMPIVIGTGGVDGTLVYFLRLLLGAGARPDRERNVPFDLAPTRGEFAVAPEGYRVILGARVGQPVPAA